MVKVADEALTMANESESSNKLSTWELWRQDDNGIRILVAQYVDQDSALNALARFESHHHKQTYWIVENRSPGLTAKPI
jgi:hypothetical protein